MALNFFQDLAVRTLNAVLKKKFMKSLAYVIGASFVASSGGTSSASLANAYSLVTATQLSAFKYRIIVRKRTS
jgi:hypothetical protein